MRNSGELYIYGMMSGTEVTFNVFDVGFGAFSGRNIHVTYFFLPDYMKTPADYSRIGNAVIKLYQTQVLRDLDGDSYSRFSLSDFKTAIKMGQEAGGGAKVLFATP